MRCYNQLCCDNLTPDIGNQPSDFIHAINSSYNHNSTRINNSSRPTNISIINIIITRIVINFNFIRIN